MSVRVVDLGAAPPALPRVTTARQFRSEPRKPLEPLVATADGRSVLLAAETVLLIAGPSGVGKSLAASFDLAGRLARDGDSDWLGLRVHAKRRVMLLAFEGSDEDTAERVGLLLPDDAQDRFTIWDRWRGLELPQNDDAGRDRLASVLREHEIDVLVIDTGPAFFGSAFGVDQGEEAHASIEDLRARSGRRLAVILVAHTKKADRKGAKVDELEEISGTFGRKADAAIVIRRVGDDESDPHRRVIFAKVRRGPQPRAKIATFPCEGDGPPRLELVGDAGRPIKVGTEAVAIAEWIAGHDEPQPAAAVRERFDLSETALRRRRGDLKAHGIAHAKLPGQGNAHGFGTVEQWAALQLGGAA